MKGKLASVRQKVYSSKTNQFQKRTALIIQKCRFWGSFKGNFPKSRSFSSKLSINWPELAHLFFPFIRPSLVCKRRHYSTCRLAVYCCLAMWACPLLVVAVVCVVCVCVYITVLFVLCLHLFGHVLCCTPSTHLMLSMRSYLFWYVLLSSFSLASVCHRFCTVGRWASWNLQYTYRTVQLLYKNIELNDFASANGMKRKHTVQYIQYIQYIRYVQYCILMLGNLLWNGYSTVLYIQYHLYSKWGMQQPVLLRLLQGPVPLPNLISIFLSLCQRSAFGLQLDQQLHRDLFQLLADSRNCAVNVGNHGAIQKWLFLSPECNPYSTVILLQILGSDVVQY